MKYEITKELETGNAMIDREHRELFGAVNQLLDACSKGQGRASMDSAVQFLLRYVNTHFSNEEQLQRNAKYPGLDSHKLFHANYKKTLKEIVSNISANDPSMADLGALNRHVGLLISHIRTEDKKLSAFLKQS
ncbi:MAG: hemerythrin family protein [Lachnospiraceae bacterium]|jgi:hemerythrin|nr:hemerythrin family protein [Lachnospiraceae bacterium]